MQDPSRPSSTSPYSVVPSYIDWLLARSFAPRPVDGRPFVQEDAIGSVDSTEGTTDLFYPLFDFGPHIFADMYYPPSIAETDQFLRYMTLEDVYNGPTGRWRSSSLPSGLEETTRETTAGDGPALNSNEKTYHIIHQDRYMKGRRAAHTIPPVQYFGFSLDSAYKKEYRDLSDADSPAWPATVPVATKLAIVLCFPGIPRYHRQVHIRRTDSRVLTRSKLANIVAREIQTFLGKLRAGNHDPLRHRGVDVALENLVLVDVQHVSKGSLQPTIGSIVSKPN